MGSLVIKTRLISENALGINGKKSLSAVSTAIVVLVHHYRMNSVAIYTIALFTMALSAVLVMVEFSTAV